MSEEMELDVDVAKPKTIDLYGVFGSFRIEKSPYLIRYVSTFANPSREDGHGEFVDELLPMRDRVKPGDLKDLRSLLQRDLSDKRVATELVPYLRGLAHSDIGFFPAILAVIVPKGFLLSAQPSPVYPVPKSEGNVTNYGGCWSYEQYRAKDKKPLPLGLFKIVESKTDIIVLDGQHRASAFRYVSGKFKPEGTIYQTFYTKPPSTTKVTADLPVTLIWFESDSGSPIEPMLISRKLFVDVNNSAKAVPLARTHLLDDRRVSCIGAQEFYSVAAANGYKSDEFSLLHTAFDMDVDLSKKPTLPCFTLTTPEIIETALQFAFLGGDASNNLNYWKVERLFSRQKNTGRFKTIWPHFKGLQAVGSDDEEDSFVGIPDPADVEKFRGLVEKDYLPVLDGLFQQFELLQPHYKACAATEAWVRTKGSTTVVDAWDKVFCGGEGLYWTLRETKDKDRGKQYRDAMSEVENKFYEERTAAFGKKENSDPVYTSFTSKAFQCGYVMAIDYLAYAGDDGERIPVVEPFINKLNEFTLPQWAAVFTRLWPDIRPGLTTDPKSWPTYRNVLLRMYDNESGEIYTLENLHESPDWKLCEKLLGPMAIATYESTNAAPSDIERKKRAAAEVEKADEILRACGLEPMWEGKMPQVVKKADEYLKAKFEELVKNG